MKLHGLFAPHLVLNESPILDHIGVRNYFFKLLSSNELMDARTYFTSAGLDPLGLGPLSLGKKL